MKKLILSLAVIAAAIGAQAQDDKTDASGLKFSLGLEAALPIGDFNKTSSFGIGGSVQGDYWIDPTLAITLNAGYINFSGKDYSIVIPGFGTTTVKGADFGLIPVLGGIKYKFTPELYGSAQLGVSLSTEKNGGSNFTYAPGIGYYFSPNFDALLKYTGYSVKGSGGTGNSALNTIGLRIAYTF